MPLPPPPIQIRPPGLLSLLGIQNGGQTPKNLGEITTPTFELADWYLRAKWEQLAVSTVAIPAGFSGGFTAYAANYTVPNDEWWYVENLSASIASGAAGSIDGFAVGFASQTISYVVSPVVSVLTAGSSSFVTSYRPFWVPPAAILGFQSGLAAGAAVSTVGRGLIARVKI